MSMRDSQGAMEFELRTAPAAARYREVERPPFRIAVLGDFSGRRNRGLCKTGLWPAGAAPIHADVDNFDSLPARLGAELAIRVGGEAGANMAVQFGSLDDFHPDRIFERLAVFQKLKEVRMRLQDSSTFPDAASQVRSWVSGESPAEKPQTEEKGGVEQTESGESDVDTLKRLLGKEPSSRAPSKTAGPVVDVDALIHEAVKPYIVPAGDPQQADLVAQVDAAISGQMRSILHDGDFQGLEATWRAMQFLVSGIETDETLKLYLVDVSKEELAADLASGKSLQSTGTYRLLVEQSVGTAGAEPWAVLVGCYSFDPTEQDIDLLKGLGGVARAAGAPFLGCAGSRFAGCESLAATPDPEDWRGQCDPAAARKWQELRGSPEAAGVGLAAPRFMLRLPYGRDTEAIDLFDFEELSGRDRHEQYLWGSPAVLCAYLLATAFAKSGWSLTRALASEVGGLPMHVHGTGDDRRTIPCAETYLTERAMGALIEKGLMPVLSVKGRDSVMLPRFQSVAEPLAPLAGRWQ